MEKPVLRVIKAPSSARFAWWSPKTEMVRDQGDFVVWFMGYEFTYFKADNPHKPRRIKRL